MPNYVVLALESALSVFGIRGIYEQPPYEVVRRLTSDIEIRRYAPRLAAQTTVSAPNADEAANQAFSLLAGYIFGKNREKAGIAMTAPVSQEKSRDIAMTAPVQSSPAGQGGMTMRFFLPSALTRETAPTPLDPRVEIVDVPSETLAVLTFSGRLTDRVRDARTKELLDGLAKSGWRATGTPFTFTYDPPFTIPFLRRNEVVVAVAAE